MGKLGGRMGRDDKRNEEEVTRMNQERYTVLSECLVLMEAQKRAFSRNEAAQEAKTGYERPYAEADKRCRVVREMLREIRYGE